MEVHIVANPHRPDAVEAAKVCSEWLLAEGQRVFADADVGALLPIPVLVPPEIGRADVMLSFGGDGTLIKAADLCAPHGTPIIGVSYGTFGFVAQCQPTESERVIRAFLNGELPTEERMMLEAKLLRNGKPIASFHSLNEVVVQRSATEHMMVFRVSVNGEKLTSYPADGVLLATATGSTAYNLSTGGPIIDPRVQAFALSAIAPHSLSARPLIFHPESVVDLTTVSAGDAVLATDGVTRLHILRGDCVRVARSPLVTRLVSVDKHDFVKKLNALLFWSHSIWREKDQ